MPKLDTSLEIQLKQFWDWWTGELLALIPAEVRKVFGMGAECVVLTVDDTGVGLSHLKSLEEIPLAFFPLDNGGENPAAAFFRENPELAELKKVLRLTHQQGLRKQIKLPMVAEENLAQVITFEMDRLTPFKGDQVYFSTVVLNRLKPTRQILVELILTPRGKLDRMLDDLARSGWRPDIVYLAGDDRPGAYNLLPERFKPDTHSWLETLHVGLGVILLSMSLLLIVLPIWSARSESLRLQADVRKASKVAQEVQSMQEESQKLLHQARFLQDKKHTEPVLIDAFEELSRIIPDGTWLNGLQFSNRRAIIQGQSPSASSLIQRIEASPFFRNVSFVSPVTKDTSNGLERFQIAADVINGRFSEKPK